jgi:hypothetical protein
MVGRCPYIVPAAFFLFSIIDILIFGRIINAIVRNFRWYYARKNFDIILRSTPDDQLTGEMIAQKLNAATEAGNVNAFALAMAAANLKQQADGQYVNTAGTA